MNSKMIAIIAVVAMCGAALVGVGYAYSAQLIDDGNSVASDAIYMTFDNTTDSTVSWTVGNEPKNDNVKVYYNYDKNNAEFTYDSCSGFIEKTVKIVVDLENSDLIAGKQLKLTVAGSGSVGAPVGTKLTLTAGNMTITSSEAEGYVSGVYSDAATFLTITKSLTQEEITTGKVTFDVYYSVGLVAYGTVAEASMGDFNGTTFSITYKVETI